MFWLFLAPLQSLPELDVFGKQHFLYLFKYFFTYFFNIMTSALS